MPMTWKTATERVSHSPELVQIILDCFLTAGNKASAKRCALFQCTTVSKAWSSIAIKNLWRSVIRIKEPLSLVAQLEANPTKGRLSEEFHHIGELNVENVGRWSTYAHHIHTLEVYEMNQLASLMLQIVALVQPEQLFPSLHTLRLHIASHGSALAGRHLIHKKLRNLQLQFVGPIDSEREYIILKSLDRCAPDLERLDILPTDVSENRKPLDFEKVLGGLRDLKHLQFTLGWFDGGIFDAIMQMRSLTSLHIKTTSSEVVRRTVFPDRASLASISEFDRPFARVKSLVLYATSVQVQLILTNYFAFQPLHHLRLRIFPVPPLAPRRSIFPASFRASSSLIWLSLHDEAKVTVDSPEARANYPLCFHESLKLLGAHNLTNLSITTLNYLSITDNELAALCQGWPRLVTIDLSPRRSPVFWNTPPPLSIKAVIGIGLNCPLIKEIGIFISPALKPLRQWLRKKENTCCPPNITSVDLGDSFVFAPEEECWTEELASMLREILPAAALVLWYDELDHQLTNVDNIILRLEQKRRRVGEKFDEELSTLRQEQSDTD